MKKLMMVLMILAMASMVQAGTYSWLDMSENETGFIIYYEDQADLSLWWKVIPADTTSIDESGIPLIPGHNYRMWITSYNSAGISDPSNEILKTPDMLSISDNLQVVPLSPLHPDTFESQDGD